MLYLDMIAYVENKLNYKKAASTERKLEVYMYNFGNVPLTKFSLKVFELLAR